MGLGGKVEMDDKVVRKIDWYILGHNPLFLLMGFIVCCGSYQSWQAERREKIMEPTVREVLRIAKGEDGELSFGEAKRFAERVGYTGDFFSRSKTLNYSLSGIQETLEDGSNLRFRYDGWSKKFLMSSDDYTQEISKETIDDYLRDFN